MPADRRQDVVLGQLKRLFVWLIAIALLGTAARLALLGSGL